MFFSLVPYLTTLAKDKNIHERFLSVYYLVFSERKRQLNEKNFKVLVFLYYNSFIPYEYLV